MRQWLGVAVDAGARATLAPLTALGAVRMIEVSKENVAAPEFWNGIMHEKPWAGMLVGTSDSPEGRMVEALACKAVTGAQMLLVVVEDFAGSFRPVDGAPASLLVVESSEAQEHNKLRWGKACPSTFICPPVRYDPHRKEATNFRVYTRNIWEDDRSGQPRVLWLGQPETADALQTLAFLMPVLEELAVCLLFKAHPRDSGYGAGQYRQFLDGRQITVRDVTDLPARKALRLGPRVVITHFSSLAVEAGFFGIPALHVLFQGAGLSRLLEKKGYTIPPWCEAGASACVSKASDLCSALQSALYDETWRANMQDKFDRYFGISDSVAPDLIRYLNTLSRAMPRSSEARHNESHSRRH